MSTAERSRSDDRTSQRLEVDIHVPRRSAAPPGRLRVDAQRSSRGRLQRRKVRDGVSVHREALQSFGYRFETNRTIVIPANGAVQSLSTIVAGCRVHPKTIHAPIAGPAQRQESAADTHIVGRTAEIAKP